MHRAQGLGFGKCIQRIFRTDYCPAETLKRGGGECEFGTDRRNVQPTESGSPCCFYLHFRGGLSLAHDRISHESQTLFAHQRRVHVRAHEMININRSS
jgi:hypothetical protein